MVPEVVDPHRLLSRVLLCPDSPRGEERPARSLLAVGRLPKVQRRVVAHEVVVDAGK